jgi:hypothetical protein
MKKYTPAQKQVDLFAPTLRTIPIEIDPTHPMVRLKGVLPWDLVMEAVERIRSTKIQSKAGARPHLRANAGAVVVRAMKSCDLRTASDLIQNYLPARYLCDLHESQWTPDFRTLSDFEIMLGDDGLSEINAIVLQAAKGNGFLDVRGLCSDTTAQEARIPYPNEVGLMRSFADSVRRGVSVIGKGLKRGSKKMIETVKTIKKLVRKHRLFAKTKESKREIEQSLSKLTKGLSQSLKSALSETKSGLTGKKEHALKRLAELNTVMQKLLPQIDYYIQKGKVAKDKIISLFLSDVRSIVRGKAGKPVEFGMKWGINQIRGGYISLFQMNGKHGEADYAVEGIREHQRLFGVTPVEFGYDRGGWSKDHLAEMLDAGVKRVAVAPKGKSKWLVSKKCRARMVNERAQVEGKIGTIKHYGFNKPNVKTQGGMRRSAQRAALRFNMTKFLKDMALNAVATA